MEKSTFKMILQQSLHISLFHNNLQLNIVKQLANCFFSSYFLQKFGGKWLPKKLSWLPKNKTKPKPKTKKKENKLQNEHNLFNLFAKLHEIAPSDKQP